MSILVNRETRLAVQGITGREGEFHTRQMIEYGTNVVAGTSPGKGGGWVAGVPVFDTLREAVEATEANTSMSGKVCLITGATAGIGLATARG